MLLKFEKLANKLKLCQVSTDMRFGVSPTRLYYPKLFRVFKITGHFIVNRNQKEQHFPNFISKYRIDVE